MSEAVVNTEKLFTPMVTMSRHARLGIPSDWFSKLSSGEQNGVIFFICVYVAVFVVLVVHRKYKNLADDNAVNDDSSLTALHIWVHGQPNSLCK